MSIDKIQLSPKLVQNLYKKVLVDTAATHIPLKQAEAPSIPSLGTNDKNIIIIVNESQTAFLPENDMTLLTGILNACQLSMADVAIVNFAKNNSLNYEELMRQFNPEFTIMFGTSPADLAFPLQFPMYQLQKYNSKSFLFSAPLRFLSEDVDQKKKLWSCLQKYFLNT